MGEKYTLGVFGNSGGECRVEKEGTGIIVNDWLSIMKIRRCLRKYHISIKIQSNLIPK